MNSSWNRHQEVTPRHKRSFYLSTAFFFCRLVSECAVDEVLFVPFGPCVQGRARKMHGEALYTSQLQFISKIVIGLKMNT
jgi:hypothetical protein